MNYVSGIDLSCLKEDQSIASGTLILDFHTSKVVHQDLLISSLMSLVLLASLPSKVPELWKSMSMASLLVLSYSIVKQSVLSKKRDPFTHVLLLDEVIKVRETLQFLHFFLAFH